MASLRPLGARWLFLAPPSTQYVALEVSAWVSASWRESAVDTAVCVGLGACPLSLSTSKLFQTARQMPCEELMASLLSFTHLDPSFQMMFGFWVFFTCCYLITPFTSCLTKSVFSCFPCKSQIIFSKPLYINVCDYFFECVDQPLNEICRLFGCCWISLTGQNWVTVMRQALLRVMCIFLELWLWRIVNNLKHYFYILLSQI